MNSSMVRVEWPIVSTTGETAVRVFGLGWLTRRNILLIIYSSERDFPK
jgi:hypothetical protein